MAFMAAATLASGGEYILHISHTTEATWFACLLSVNVPQSLNSSEQIDSLPTICESSRFRPDVLLMSRPKGKKMDI